jgi:Spy/CpxP family protein refolding chaperone
MRHWICVIALALSATPVFAQQEQSEEQTLRELGMGGTFALGNLALRDLQRGNDPVQQLKRFFAQAKLPLSSAQVKQLESVVDAQGKALLASAGNEDAARKVNQEYSRKVNEVLTPEQRTELRRYRTEQIMMRGGFQALRLIMENAQTPFTDEQEKQIQAIYVDFNQQVDKVTLNNKSTSGRAELDKLENEALGKVVRLLTLPQRRALAASRQGTITGKIRP